jgi:agmatinase
MRTLNINKNFLAIEDKYSNYRDSRVVMLPVPYGKGPAGIYNASHYVEFFDEELNREFCFEKGNGIASLYPVAIKGLKGKKALDVIYKDVLKLIKDKKFVVTLGGEHTISTAPIKAHFDSYKELSILHFDAHSDLRDEYEGNRYSHASVPVLQNLQKT